MNNAKGIGRIADFILSYNSGGVGRIAADCLLIGTLAIFGYYIIVATNPS